MKRGTRYAALDVHQTTTLASVRDEGGRVIARAVLPTEGSVIVEFFRGMRGAIQLAFEEGTQAQWLHDLLGPVVDRVVVCDRRGKSRDARDATAEGAVPSAGRQDTGHERLPAEASGRVAGAAVGRWSAIPS